MPDDIAYCVRQCGQLAVGESIIAMSSENLEIVELVCYEHSQEEENGQI